ncbi:MAG TPA: hypothetical protein VL123_01355 [Candidatus Udaeobacter sp.]|nr:hypothetical protein [Candidatus Udaeobacter sp.]
MMNGRWIRFGVLLLTLVAGAAVGRAEPCRPLNGIDLCPLAHSLLDARTDSDTIRTVLPAEPASTEFGASLAVSPARSFSLDLDPSVREGVTGPWLEALARVSSSSARVIGNATREGALSPLSVRVTHVVPKKPAIAYLAVSASLPKTLNPRVGVVVADHGSVVWQSDSRPTGEIAEVGDWPDGVRGELQPMGGLQLIWRYDKPTQIRIRHAASARDSTVTGDELRIAGPGSPASSLTQGVIRASGMDSIRVSSPVVIHGSVPVSRALRRPRPR